MSKTNIKRIALIQSRKYSKRSPSSNNLLLKHLLTNKQNPNNMHSTGENKKADFVHEGGLISIACCLAAATDNIANA